jgi:hypothetical protein
MRMIATWSVQLRGASNPTGLLVGSHPVVLGAIIEGKEGNREF